MVTNSDPDFVRSLGLGFLAHRLKRTSELILEQSAAALSKLGVDVPARSASTILLLAREGSKSITEIAFRLQFSHPFVIKLCDGLVDAGLASSERDQSDARRRIIALTDGGFEAAQKVERFTKALGEAFQQIFDRSGVDMLSALERFEAAASQPSIAELTERAFTEQPASKD